MIHVKKKKSSTDLGVSCAARQSSLQYYIYEAGANLHSVNHCPLEQKKHMAPFDSFLHTTCRLLKAPQSTGILTCEDQEERTKRVQIPVHTCSEVLGH